MTNSITLCLHALYGSLLREFAMNLFVINQCDLFNLINMIYSLLIYLTIN